MNKVVGLLTELFGTKENNMFVDFCRWIIEFVSELTKQIFDSILYPSRAVRGSKDMLTVHCIL